ncbi:MAG: DUF3224 domain-containing protein, partial [Nocardioides sp.]
SSGGTSSAAPTHTMGWKDTAMAEHARGTFAVTLTPEESGLPMVGRFALEKTYAGDAVGTGAGIMLSGGDPASGEAGYVVLEVAELTIASRSGTFAMQQLGTMSGGDQSITYVVTPGSGTGDLAGITGRLELDIRDGQHHYDLVYELPDA